MTNAAVSSGRRSFSEPLNARPIGRADAVDDDSFRHGDSSLRLPGGRTPRAGLAPSRRTRWGPVSPVYGTIRARDAPGRRARDALRGAPDPPARGRLPDARLARRGRRRRAGGLDPAEPRGRRRDREPRRLADHGRRRGSAWTCCAARDPRARSRSTRAMPDPIVSARPTAPTPSTRRCSPTRSGSRCSSCSTRSTPAERLAFVLHDLFARAVRRDRADRRAARPPRRASSRAARGGGCRARAGARRRPRAPARGRRRVPRRRPRRRLRRAARRARPGRRAARRRRRAARRARSPARRRATWPARRSRSRGAPPSRAARRSSTAPPASSSFRDGRLYAVMGFTVRGGRIVAIDILADPERLAALDLSRLG